MKDATQFHIRPARPDEAGLFYAQHPEEDKRLGTAGHVRMDFGRSGNEFWHTWWPRDSEKLNSPVFKAELQEVVDTLRESVLKNRFAIIDLPHPTSQNHPRMSLHDRAAQFSPFAALTGHHAAITETGRLTDRRIELDESEIARVDAELQHLQELLPGRPTVSITYFVPDERKNGGSYQTVTSEVKRIDAVAGMIQMADRQLIPIADVFSIEIIP